MKFVRFGERGAEKPGAIDENGDLRDLSAVVPDIAGDVLGDLAVLARLDLGELPKVGGTPRLGACVGGDRKIHVHRTELFRPCCGIRDAGAL